MLEIKVLGMGCPNCERLKQLCEQIVTENNIQARIEKIADFKRFADYGLLVTPGLVINDKLVSSGKIPDKSSIIQWIMDALSSS